MKIRTRLTLVLTVLAALIGLVSVTAVTAFARLGGTIADAMRENVRSINACADMSRAVGRTDRGFLLLLAGQSAAGVEAITGGDADFATALAVARSNITLDGEKEKVDALTSAYRRYLAATEPFRIPPAVAAPSPAPGAAPPPAPAAPSPAPSPAPVAASRVADYVVVVEPLLSDIRDALRDLSGINHAGIEAHSAAASRSGWRRSAWVFSVGALGLGLAILLGRRLYRSITVPLDAIRRTITAIGRGNLARRVAFQADDELGQIAVAVNATAERLAAEDATREGRQRLHQRLAGAVLDALDPLGFVVNREAHVVLVGTRVRSRLGDDPLGTLRQGVGGLIAPGEIDRRLEEILISRPSQVPPAAGTPEGIAVQPVVGPGGSILGALIRVRA